jgi:hypothetical protein
LRINVLMNGGIILGGCCGVLDAGRITVLQALVVKSDGYAVLVWRPVH